MLSKVKWNLQCPDSDLVPETVSVDSGSVVKGVIIFLLLLRGQVYVPTPHLHLVLHPLTPVQVVGDDLLQPVFLLVHLTAIVGPERVRGADVDQLHHHLHGVHVWRSDLINGLCGELTGLGLLDGLLTLLELAFSYLLPLQVYEQLLLEGALLGQLNSNINLRNENLQYQLR